MDDEQYTSIDALLTENLRLTRENNKLLKKIHRTHLIEVWSKILLVLIAIGIPIFIYQYYMEDYVKHVRTTYEETRLELKRLDEVLEKIRSLPAGLL